MSEHLAFGLFLLSLLIEMSGQEQTYNPLRHRHFYKSQEIHFLEKNKIKSQYDFYSRVGFFVNEHCNIKTNHTDDET